MGAPRASAPIEPTEPTPALNAAGLTRRHAYLQDLPLLPLVHFPGQAAVGEGVLYYVLIGLRTGLFVELWSWEDLTTKASPEAGALLRPGHSSTPPDGTPGQGRAVSTAALGPPRARGFPPPTSGHPFPRLVSRAATSPHPVTAATATEPTHPRARRGPGDTEPGGPPGPKASHLLEPLIPEWTEALRLTTCPRVPARLRV